MYKSKLQELCHQRQWTLPRYTSMKDGPDHNPGFKSSVFLNGMSFNSSVPCKFCKEAQNDAAKSAFLHFSSSSYSLEAASNPNPVQEVDLGIYKNLLQELTQREEWSSPEYKTMKCGGPHRTTYFFSVEVEGDAFYGNEGKPKKEAEINAAKAAYTNLTERLQVSSSESDSESCSPQDNLQVVSNSVSVTTVETEEHGEEKVGNFPAQVTSPATFRCVRLSFIEEDSVDRYAYRTAVNIGGHVFKGILYDQGADQNQALIMVATDNIERDPNETND